ncbi:MAG: hypothetical protein LBK18_04310 [Prevotellaceae bacterium]|jgi:hypothetical protein|nr:hypothetical protein [Prevotellaceae bacterium]
METPQEQELLQQKEFLLNGTPVAMLTGNEFEKKEGVMPKQQVKDFYDSIKNRVNSVFGEVILDNQAVKDDFGHGIGKNKMVAFSAVPNVLERGISILNLDYYKAIDPKIKSGMIAAPITIKGEEFIAVCLVRQNKEDRNRLYVHEVTLKEKLLIKSSNKKLPSGSSNPTQSLATERGVRKLSDGSSNPALQEKPAQATNQGAITKVLQNILSAKSTPQDSQKNLAAAAHTRPAGRAVKRRGRGL